MPGEVEGVERFEVTSNPETGQPEMAASPNPLGGGYIRASDLSKIRSQERQRVRELLEGIKGQLRPGVAIGKVPQANVARAYRRIEAELAALDSLEDEDANA